MVGFVWYVQCTLDMSFVTRAAVKLYKSTLPSGSQHLELFVVARLENLTTDSFARALCLSFLHSGLQKLKALDPRLNLISKYVKLRLVALPALVRHSHQSEWSYFLTTLCNVSMYLCITRYHR